uniref:Uncharacterized protein n=1 Tax=Anguilla anguilla TaxID=7936 RepID=A0A0E9TU77_ANGAN
MKNLNQFGTAKRDFSTLLLLFFLLQVMCLSSACFFFVRSYDSVLDMHHLSGIAFPWGPLRFVTLL